MKSLSAIENKIRLRLEEAGIELYGWTRLNRPLSMDLYKDWIQQGEHLDMSYLESQLETKKSSQQWHRTRMAQSAIVLAIPYYPHPWPTEPTWQNRTALYSKGLDYHSEIPKTLNPLLASLRNDFPEAQFEVFTDSAPILERDLAYRAGLGWIGKNTCLINRQKGSLFFLAEIYTSLDLTNQDPWSPDFCGTCQRCLEACPTQALLPERKLLPSRCISYWTIEAKSVAPENLRTKIGDWLFGCDICQTVCPWNQKHLKEKVESLQPLQPSLQPLSQTLTQQSAQQPDHQLSEVRELEWILTSSRKTLARELHHTPLARAAGWKLQRNAIVVATNRRFTSLIPFIQKWQDDEKLGELARWALTQLTQDKASATSLDK